MGWRPANLQAASLWIKRDELHNQIDDQEVKGRQVRRVDMNAIDSAGNRVHATRWHDPVLDIVVRQQANDGAIDELRNIRIETIQAEMFAIPDGYKTVDSQLTDLNTETGNTFGTDNT